MHRSSCLSPPGRLRSVCEDADVIAIEECPVALAAAELFQNADGNQSRDEVVRRRIAEIGDVPNFGNRHDRLLVQYLQYTVAVAGSAPEAVSHNGAMGLSQVEDPASRRCSLVADLGYSAQEKGEPAFPVARIPHGLQSIIVLGSMLFEVMRDIENRLGENASLAEKERDQQSAYPTVPVEEGMNRLKLCMDQSDANEWGILSF